NLNSIDLHGMNLTNAGFIGANFSNADLRNARFDGDEMVGANMRDAKLDGASLRNAWICSHNNETDDGVTYNHEVECIRLRGASVRGTVFTGAQLCDHENGERTCSTVDAATLRDKSENDLTGAVLP
ncbi:MAG TPA: pentapeptide repeat-containing protein, partial [Candidatus Aquilonibacter sp.]